MLPSPTDIKYIIEVANTLNLSRASERLGISQPSLTLAVQRLEDSIGTKILTRSNKGVIFTQAGKQLITHAKHLLQTWDQLRTNALASILEVQGTYTIGCHPSVALYTLSGFLPRFMEQHPKVEIQLKHDLSRRIAEEVISSSIDIGVAVNPVKHPDLIISKICNDEVAFWSNGENRPNLDIDSGSAVLICDSALIQTQNLLRQIKKHKINIGRVIESNNLDVITDLVGNGCGIGILPTRVAQSSKSKKLKKLSNSPIFKDEICLLMRVENKGVRSIQALKEAIISNFDKR